MPLAAILSFSDPAVDVFMIPVGVKKAVAKLHGAAAP